MKLGVSCLCPTYGRPPEYLRLLDEAVESFLRQEYEGPKELLILNDCPQQVLECDLPGVRVVNTIERLPSLGAKYNLMVELARYDTLFPWEDDDISLPGRIDQGMSNLLLGLHHYWNPQRTWFLPGDNLSHNHDHGVCHNASVYTRNAWKRAGRYPNLSGAQDAHMDSRLKSLWGTAPPLQDDPSNWQYIYCWGRSNLHLSSRPDTDRAYGEHGRQRVTPGSYPIQPQWYRDYTRMTNEMAVRYHNGSKPEMGSLRPNPPILEDGRVR